MVKKAKNYIIKKLGGYTAEEYKSATSIRAPKIREITRLDLVSVKAKTTMTQAEAQNLSQEIIKKLLKERLKRQIEKEAEPFVQFVLWKPVADGVDFVAEAELHVLRPREGE